MTKASAAIALATLGVDDLPRATRFYADLGFEKSVTPRSPFGGITLARTLPSREAVDDAYAHALASGATPLKPPQEVFWGGYSGYVADPDGHPIELAWNPFFPMRDDGSIALPM